MLIDACCVDKHNVKTPPNTPGELCIRGPMMMMVVVMMMMMMMMMMIRK